MTDWKEVVEKHKQDHKEFYEKPPVDRDQINRKIGFIEGYDELASLVVDLLEVLEKIATIKYLVFRQGDLDPDHQYRMGVTDGRRIAAEWASKALAKAQELQK